MFPVTSANRFYACSFTLLQPRLRALSIDKTPCSVSRFSFLIFLLCGFVSSTHSFLKQVQQMLRIPPRIQKEHSIPGSNVSSEYVPDDMQYTMMSKSSIPHSPAFWGPLLKISRISLIPGPYIGMRSMPLSKEESYLRHTRMDIYQANMVHPSVLLLRSRQQSGPENWSTSSCRKVHRWWHGFSTSQRSFWRCLVGMFTVHPISSIAELTNSKILSSFTRPTWNPSELCSIQRKVRPVPEGWRCSASQWWPWILYDNHWGWPL